MPRAKKPKLDATSKAPSKTTDRPLAAEIEGESGFAQLARQHWLKSTKRATTVKVKEDVLKGEIWDPLEKDGFPLKDLLVLEGLQVLERWVATPQLATCPKTTLLTSTSMAATFGQAIPTIPRTYTFCL
jgi:intron-binding protein aquarius